MTPAETLKAEIETEAAYLNRALEVAKAALEQYAGGKTWSFIASDALAEIRELTGQPEIVFDRTLTPNGELRAIRPGDETRCPRCSEHPERYDERLLCPTCLGVGRVVWRLTPTAILAEVTE